MSKHLDTTFQSLNNSLAISCTKSILPSWHSSYFIRSVLLPSSILVFSCIYSCSFKQNSLIFWSWL
jgi:hypothetical protein